MIKKLLVLFLLIWVPTAEANIQSVGYVDCYGGIDADGRYWQLLDHLERPLEDGDWVYAAWTGPDSAIDPPDSSGYPTGDDVKLPLAAERIEYSCFLLTVATWEPGYRDDTGQERHPHDGETIYCRIFDAPQESVGPETHYSDSQLHTVNWKKADEFYCLFPGDPGQGQTRTPLSASSVSGESSSVLSLTEVGLRQIPLFSQHPTVLLEYVVPADANVLLKIYDRTGREVTTLIDAFQHTGQYSQKWNSEDWPAGVYVAVLKVGDKRVLKRIVLLHSSTSSIDMNKKQ